ncbi:hypothetical protein ABZT34_10460 [Streptomyces sp. NPDC005329]|uniref:hypothetical protein n=1 Tax=Streptomyces sp. NPDC005329 TaxID=3157034 RepID=UPI0033BD11DD
MLCDFCSATAAEFVYVIPMGFLPSIGGALQADDGRWNACHECAALVDARDPLTLARYVVDVMARDALNPMALTPQGRADLIDILTIQYVALLNAQPSKESL